MARTGNAISVNRYATRTSWPASMSPLPSRAVPASSTASTPSTGSDSMTGSNSPRTRPTAVIVSRSSSEAVRKRSVSEALPAERLDDQRAVEGLVRDAADLAALLLGQRHQGRHPARVEDGQPGDRGEDDRADEREHRVGDEEQAERGDEHEDHTDGERERRDRVPGRLDVAVGVGQQLAGRVLRVPGQRQLEVAPGHPAAVGGLQPVLHDPGAEPAGDDPDDLQGGDQHHREEGDRQRGHHDLAVLDAGDDDPLGDGAEDVRLADGGEGEQRAADR
jgi:hypothetical protein